MENKIKFITYTTSFTQPISRSDTKKEPEPKTQKPVKKRVEPPPQPIQKPFPELNKTLPTEPVLNLNNEPKEYPITKNSYIIERNSIYSFGDENMKIIMHNHVLASGSISHGKDIPFSISIKNNIVPQQKEVCMHNFYFNYSNNHTITIGKINLKNGNNYACVTIEPINSQIINLYSLLYNLSTDARLTCSQCSGSLYLLIAYYIIQFVNTKQLIKITRDTIFTVYDNAIKTIVKSNSSVKANNIKLSVEQLLKYNRTYYEAFGLCPHIIFSKQTTDLVATNDIKVSYALAPTDAQYVEFFRYFVNIRKTFLNMTVGQIKKQFYDASANTNAKYDFWKINNIDPYYLLFVNMKALEEIMHNTSDTDNNTKLNVFLSTYPDVEQIHMMFYLPKNINDSLDDVRVIRIYTPLPILEEIIQIYKNNNIQIYEPYFRVIRFDKD